MLDDKRKSELDAFAGSLKLKQPPQEQPPQEQDRNFITGNLAAGIDSAQASLGGLEAFAGRTANKLGFDGSGMVKQGNEIADRNRAESEQNAVGIRSLEDAHGFGDVVNFAAGEALRSLPAMAVTLAGTAAGALAAPELATAGAVGSVLAKASPYIGGAAVSAPLAVGGIHADTEQQGSGANTNVLGELGAGVVSGALDAIAPGHSASALMRGTAGKLVQQNALREAGKGALKTGVLEGSTEVAQTAIEKAGTASSTNSFDMNGWDVLNSFVAGATVGGAMGGAVGYHTADTRSDEEISQALKQDVEPDKMSTAKLIQLHKTVEDGSDARAVAISQDLLEKEIEHRVTAPVDELNDTQLFANLELGQDNERSTDVIDEVVKRIPDLPDDALNDAHTALSGVLGTDSSPQAAKALHAVNTEIDSRKPLDERINLAMQNLSEDVNESMASSKGAGKVQKKIAARKFIQFANESGVELTDEQIKLAADGDTQVQLVTDMTRSAVRRTIAGVNPDQRDEVSKTLNSKYEGKPLYKRIDKLLSEGWVVKDDKLVSDTGVTLDESSLSVPEMLYAKVAYRYPKVVATKDDAFKSALSEHGKRQEPSDVVHVKPPAQETGVVPVAKYSKPVPDGSIRTIPAPLESNQPAKALPAPEEDTYSGEYLNTPDGKSFPLLKSESKKLDDYRKELSKRATDLGTAPLDSKRSKPSETATFRTPARARSNAEDSFGAFDIVKVSPTKYKAVQTVFKGRGAADKVAKKGFVSVKLSGDKGFVVSKAPKEMKSTGKGFTEPPVGEVSSQPAKALPAPEEDTYSGEYLSTPDGKLVPLLKSESKKLDDYRKELSKRATDLGIAPLDSKRSKPSETATFRTPARARSNAEDSFGAFDIVKVSPTKYKAVQTVFKGRGAADKVAKKGFVSVKLSGDKGFVVSKAPKEMKKVSAPKPKQVINKVQHVIKVNDKGYAANANGGNRKFRSIPLAHRDDFMDDGKGFAITKERYMSKKFSRGATPTGSVFTEYNPSGRVASRLSSNITTLDKTTGITDELAAKYGNVTFHDVTPNDVPPDVRGWVEDDGSIHIVKSNNTPESLHSVVIHESLHNYLINNKISVDAFDKGSEWYSKAEDKARSVDTPVEHLPDEIMAYAVQHYEETTGSIRKAVDKFLAKIKNMLTGAFGADFKMTDADLHALAVSNLHDLSVGYTDRMYSRGDVEYHSKAMTDARRNFDEATKAGAFHNIDNDVLTEYASLLDKIGVKKLTPQEQFIDEVQTAGKSFMDGSTFRKIRASIQDSNIELLHADKLKGGKHVRSDNSRLYISATMTRHAHAQATAFVDLHGGQLKYNKETASSDFIEGKKSLNAILASLEGDPKQFAAWMVAVRAKELNQVGDKKMISDSEYAAALKFSEESEHFPNWKDVNALLTEFDDNKLQYAVDAGSITPETKTALQKYGNFIPLSRIKEDGSIEPEKDDGLFFGSGLIRRHGDNESGRSIDDIFKNMQKNVLAVMQSASHAIAMRNIEEHLREQNEDGKTLYTVKGAEVWLTDAEAKESNAKPVYPSGVWRQVQPFKKVLATATSIHNTDMKMLKPLLDEMGISKNDLSLQDQQQLLEITAFVAPTGKKSVSFVMDGERQYRMFNDTPENHAMVRAISSLADVRGAKAYGNASTQMSWFIKAKTILTQTITKTPPFWAASIFRDSLSVMGTTDVKVGISDIVKGWMSSHNKDATYMKAWANGALPSANGYDNTDMGRILDKAARPTPTGLAAILHKYNEFAGNFENAARIAVFKAAMEGKGVNVKTGEPVDNSLSQGAFIALDTLDFARRGDSHFVGFFLDTVPFLNARIQGLARLGRGATEHKAAMVKVGTAMFLLAGMNALMNSENDEYKALTDEQKDLYLHLYIPGTKLHFAFPKPFEFGLIATAAERFVSFMNGDDSSKVIQERALFAFTSTLGMNPVPQLIKPIVQLSANSNWFTGRDIVPLQQTHMDSSLQESPFQHKSMVVGAHVIDDSIPDSPAWLHDTLTSPRKLEFLLRGYFGSAIDMAASAVDAILNKVDGTVVPEGRAIDLTPLKRFMPEFETKNSAYMTRLYIMSGIVGKYKNSLRQMRVDKDITGIKMLSDKYPAAIKYGTKVTNVIKYVRVYNRQVMKLMKNPGTRSPAELKTAIDLIVRKRNALAKTVNDYYGEF